VEITIVDDAHVIVNRTTFDRAALGSALQSMIAASPTREVIVRCSDRVTHGTFVSVLDEAKRCGAGRVAVVGS
jgi:biopolymer transport protein ExbD